MIASTTMSKSEQFIALEDQFGAHNYHPLPVVLERGEWVFVFDVDGKEPLIESSPDWLLIGVLSMKNLKRRRNIHALYELRFVNFLLSIESFLGNDSTFWFILFDLDIKSISNSEGFYLLNLFLFHFPVLL